MPARGTARHPLAPHEILRLYYAPRVCRRRTVVSGGLLKNDFSNRNGMSAEAHPIMARATGIESTSGYFV